MNNILLTFFFFVSVMVFRLDFSCTRVSLFFYTFLSLKFCGVLFAILVNVNHFLVQLKWITVMPLYQTIGKEYGKRFNQVNVQNCLLYMTNDANVITSNKLESSEF